jgi:hypothetical protein
LRLIDEIQMVGNNFILDSIDLYYAACTTSEQDEARKSEICALQRNGS